MVSTGHTFEYITPLRLGFYGGRAQSIWKIGWLRPALFPYPRRSPVTPPNKVRGRRRHIGGASSHARLYKARKARPCGRSRRPRDSRRPRGRRSSRPTSPALGRPRPTRERRPYIPRTVRHAVPLRRQAVRHAAMPLCRPVVVPAPVLRGSIRALPDGGDVPPHPLYACAYTRTRV